MGDNGYRQTRMVSVDETLAWINSTMPSEPNIEPVPYTPATWITADVMADNLNAAMQPEPRR